jgi:hypothetical protein
MPPGQMRFYRDYIDIIHQRQRLQMETGYALFNEQNRALAGD